MDERIFTAPPFEVPPRRRVEVPFSGTVAALGYLTLVSGMITYPFRIVKAKMFFTDDAFNLVEMRWFISRSSNAPTGDFPTDDNVFGRESPTAGFIGRGIVRVVDCDIEVPGGMVHLKLSAYNGNAAAYYLNGSITLEAL